MRAYQDYKCIPDGALCRPASGNGSLCLKESWDEWLTKTKYIGSWEAEETTPHENLCILLKVPESGNPEIDRLITESRRWDLCLALAQGLAGDPDAEYIGVDWVEKQSNALIEKLKGGKG